METREKKIDLTRVWRLCPVRHALLCAASLWTGFYFLFRGRRGWMNFLCRTLTRPWHRLAGRFYSSVPFSVSELVIGLWIVLGICFLVQLIIHIRRRGSGESLYRWFISALVVIMVLFALFCLWWGVLYYSDSFTGQAGLERRPIAAEELESVTRYFASVANEYSSRADRDERGIFTADEKELFEHSRTLYRAAEETFPCLAGPELRAKPALFSRLLSATDTTGYFFAYTAEANLNVDCTMAMIPATIGHELAHQRGVAREDEANFVGIFACMEDGDDAFVYSGALMAYVYLGNALHDTDYDAWEQVYRSLNEDVRRDLDDHNAYWKRYDTKVSEVSDKVYEGFLRTYGDDRGMKSYDACVDLLVLWYLDAANG